MSELPEILPVTANPQQMHSGYRTLDTTVPGPASPEFAPDKDRQAAKEASAEAPNRLGAERVSLRLYEPGGNHNPHTQPFAEPWATLVWAHGGSFIRGTLDWPESDWVAARFAERGVRVLSVDYTLISDTVKGPAPANDVAAVLRWVDRHYGGKILVGGASAGANLATQAALLQAADAAAGIAGAAAGLVMIYPTLHRVQRLDATIEGLVEGVAEQKRFRADRIAEMYATYMGPGFDQVAAPEHDFTTAVEDLPRGPVGLTDEERANQAGAAASGDGGGQGAAASPARTAAAGEGQASLSAITELIEQIRAAQAAKEQAVDDPALDEVVHYPRTPVVVGELQARQLGRLPQTVIVNAERDELRASGEQFAEQLREAGVTVTEFTQANMLHGYINSPDSSDDVNAAAVETIEQITETIRAW